MKKTALALATLLFAAGCFEIEHSIDLEKDLSGTADVHLGVDLEPLVVVMAQFAKEMEGKSGPLTAAELAEAKAEFKKQSSKEKDKPPSRDEIEKSLPEGVTLIDYKVEEKEFGVASDFRFGFDRLSRLVSVKLPSGGDDPAKKNVVDSPFEGLELVESGDTITIRTKPQNPVETVKVEAGEMPKLDAATEKFVRDTFEKMRVVYRITAPFEIVSHNATRREGKTLVWEYDIDEFEKLQQAATLDAAQLKVTYRR